MNKELQDVQLRYKDNPKSKRFSALIFGALGCGKTKLAETCPKPVLIHSFDPDGTNSIDPSLIESGDVIVDNRWEGSGPFYQTAFNDWEQEMRNYLNSGVFEEVGTFMVDTLTTWSFSARTLIQHATKDLEVNKKITAIEKLAKAPDRWDYSLEHNTVLNCIRLILSVPCNVIVTAHDQVKVNENEGVIERAILATGKLTGLIPPLFSEFYGMERDGDKRYLITQKQGKWPARTRYENKLQPQEAPDISNILRKIGG